MSLCLVEGSASKHRVLGLSELPCACVGGTPVHVVSHHYLSSPFDYFACNLVPAQVHKSDAKLFGHVYNEGRIPLHQPSVPLQESIQDTFQNQQCQL